MANFSFKFDASKLQRRLNEMSQGFSHSSEGQDVVKKSSAAGMAEAIEAAPRDTGDLKRAIKLIPLQISSKGLQGGFDVNIKYAAPINYGFVHAESGEFIQGVHFMEAGYLTTKKYVHANMSKAIKKFLSKG